MHWTFLNNTFSSFKVVLILSLLELLTVIIHLITFLRLYAEEVRRNNFDFAIFWILRYCMCAIEIDTVLDTNAVIKPRCCIILAITGILRIIGYNFLCFVNPGLFDLHSTLVSMLFR
jgi:hypothetical protein